eukprot:TRINITY_DN2860_c0_g1_i2.p1 TRINITY_DN2860_c0_g1~~TRINITY_DN2860_c0_g1_i2.p1  ORF type:complete len:274 (+),score=55.52 TRINITY_DN2860_c0_g1_i2:300-1121(+)
MRSCFVLFRLTGGEPSVRKDIVDITEEIGKIPQIKKICMTSNGIALVRKLPLLKEAGLDYLNVSLDTLTPSKFEYITRRRGFENALKSIQTALDLGFKSVKINCVVMKGFNDNEILDFVAWTRDLPIEVRFIEYMPFDGNTWETDKMMPYQDIIKEIKGNGYNLVKVKDEKNFTSRSYQVKGYKGKIGFISSMSDMFCGGCNRMRLLADGSLKLCLFGQKEYSLRDKIREGLSNEELKSYISEVILEKKKSHDGMELIDLNKQLNRPMILIGG